MNSTHILCIMLSVTFLCFILIYCDFLRCIFSRAMRSIINSPRSHVQVQHQVEVVDDFFPDDTSNTQSGGLDNSVINSLPVSKYEKKEGKQNPVNAECAICLGEFEEGEELKLLPNCTHGFHVPCIDSWFRSNSNCPLCRCSVHVQYDEDADADADSACAVYSRESLEPLRREEFSQLSDVFFRSIRSEVLRNLANRPHTI